MTSLAVAGLMASAASAGATYGFTHIVEDGDGPTQLADGAIGVSQLSLELKDTAGSAEFLFKNSGPDAAVVTQIYWFDVNDQLTSLDSWTSASGGPDYGAPPNSDEDKGKLPGYGGKNISDFDLKPDPSPSKNGIDIGEDLSVFFSYTGTYLEILEAIDSGDIVVGVHVQAYKSGGSESFVTGPPPKDPPTGVPSPTAALAGMGLMGLLVSRRRRRN